MLQKSPPTYKIDRELPAANPAGKKKGAAWELRLKTSLGGGGGALTGQIGGQADQRVSIF
jgi:hypothetical protein